MKQFNDFQRLYSRSITLRFELIPQGKTLKHFVDSGILAQDEHRAESYKAVKGLIDDYHKRFITHALSGFRLNVDSSGSYDSLTEYLELYDKPNKSNSEKKQFAKIQDNLRGQIADRLSKQDNSKFKRLFGKELIQEDLLNNELMRELTDTERQQVNEFKNFTTYFTGFFENRRNMYSKEAKSTAIPYRLIHDNLPKFLDNIKSFEKLMHTEIAGQIPMLSQSLEDHLCGEKLQDFFSLSHYSSVLTQEQIDNYNILIGGKTIDGEKPIQGLNVLINLYNQQHPEQKLPLLKLLFKQILSDRTTASWLVEELTSDTATLKAISEFFNESFNVLSNNSELKNLLQTISSYDLSKIYIANDKSITDISQRIFGDWSTISRAIMANLQLSVKPKRQEDESAYEERLRKILNQIDQFSILYINECLVAAEIDRKLTIDDYFFRLGEVNTAEEQTTNLFIQIELAYADVKPLLSKEYPVDANLAQDDRAITKIKKLLDSVKALQAFIKPLLGKGEQADKDALFYSSLMQLWQQLDGITPLYNKVRNYMTRKPYSQEKLKLNFANSTLMDGWDLNKEEDNYTVILRKAGLYYLGIMNKAAKKVFNVMNLPTDGDCYEKMEYKLLPGPNKMLPKVFFSKSRIAEFAPSEQVLQIHKDGSFKKGDNFSIDNCHALIDFFTKSIQKHEDWSKFDFYFSDTESFKDISGFYKEVEQQGYKLTFRDVSATYIDQLVDEGKLYLFQIYNKDFSPNSKGTPNLHTLYWEMLFDERNLANVVYKLNGQAEVFYRRKSIINNNTIHHANVEIERKNPRNKDARSKFPYDIVKNRRYTVDKFQFHVPITMNFKNEGIKDINPMVWDYLKNTDDVYVIGIDRGERNLLYYSLIDKNGNIIEQASLNVIGNYDYLNKLNEREIERDIARKSWKSIEGIKELKEGYLSLVIHKIAQLMVRYHAIVVLEDLNFGFKRSRQKFEKQVYQNFEKALIDKLNYLVDKKADANAPGGLLNAFQLTNKFESFQQLSKQCGFLLYVQANYTSKIDPTTGFVSKLNTRYETVDKARSFFDKFSTIKYNADNDWFEFAFDYNAFSKELDGTRTQWTICTHGERIEQFRNPDKNNNWDSRSINLTAAFKECFAHNNIAINGNLKAQIVERKDKSFFEQLLHLIKLTLQLRNTDARQDRIISPVRNSYGAFYDSNCPGKMPIDADANGAYNIALKGLLTVRRMKQATDSKKPNYAISTKEWLQFVQDKPFLKD
jgi:CRISPR-associated protein Cpf1